MLSFWDMLLFGFKPTWKGCFTYLCFHNDCLGRRLDVVFLALNPFFFHLQITGVYYNITSHVTGKSTDLAFEF